jgi:hypothetical protein
MIKRFVFGIVLAFMVLLIMGSGLHSVLCGHPRRLAGTKDRLVKIGFGDKRCRGL